MLNTKRAAEKPSHKAMSKRVHCSKTPSPAPDDRLRQLAIDADDRAGDAHNHGIGETLWHEIALAGWSPVDAFEAQGRRYLIAKSPVPPERVVAIETLDRIILSSRATGTSLKVIASDLGLSITTVARRLRSAMQQLGLLNAADLTAVFGQASR